LSVAVTSAAVGANRDASAIYFAYDDLKRSAVILDALTPTGADAGTATVTTNLGTVIGVIGDDGAAIVGIGTPTGQCQASDCVSFDFSGGDQSNTAGDLYRVTQGGGITGHQSTTFDVTFSEHLLAADAASVYWIGGGKLHSA